MKVVYAMRQTTEQKSIAPTVSSSDTVNRALLASLHPGILLINGLFGAIMYIMFMMPILKFGLNLGFEEWQPLGLSTLRDMDLPFMTRLNVFVISGYKPILSELAGLLLGCCLCILEIQELRTISRTSSLRLGLVATLYRKCDVRENIPACRKFRTFRYVEVLKILCLSVPILTIGIVTGLGLLIPVSVSYVPHALAAIFRKKLLVSITDDISVSQDYSVSALQYESRRILSRFILVVTAVLLVSACVVIIFFLTG